MNSKTKEYKSNYYQKNKDDILTKQKTYREKNPAKIREQKHKSYLKNKDTILVKQKEYNNENNDEVSERQHNWYIANKERLLEKAKKRYEENPKEIIQSNIKYAKERRKIDPIFKIIGNLRHRTNMFFHGQDKSETTSKLIGCSANELRIYFENKFYPNPKTNEIMTWNNYGFYGWHIDHIIPLSSFDLKDNNQLKKACHYTNLQPLWAKENLSKGAKIK